MSTNPPRMILHDYYDYCQECGRLTRIKYLCDCGGCGAILCQDCLVDHDEGACLHHHESL